MGQKKETEALKCPHVIFGIECGKGWKDLYQPIIHYIEDYNKDKEGDDKIEILQIKEKFGGLRFYTNFVTQELTDMIDEAESKSYHTCEACGRYIKAPIIENHWIYSECQECHSEWKLRREEAFEKIQDKMDKKTLN